MDSKQDSKPLSPHDSFFKGMFSQYEVASSYIKHFLPQSLWQNLPLDQLILDNNSCITHELRAYYSDLVWVCPFKNTQVSIAFLFEHKSFQPRYPHIQLLRYMLQMWEHDINHKSKTLRPIIPIIVYQGSKKWKSRSMKEYFPSQEEHFMKYLPLFEYELNDLQQLPENELLTIKSLQLTSALYTMANFRNIIKTIDALDKIFLVASRYKNTDKNTNFVEMILVYLMKTHNLKPSNMKELIEKAKSKPIRKVKSTYEQFVDEGIKIGIKKGREEGREEGMEQGIEKGIEKGIELAIIKAFHAGHSIGFIANLFDMPSEKVRKIIDRNSNK